MDPFPAAYQSASDALDRIEAEYSEIRRRSPNLSNPEALLRTRLFPQVQDVSDDLGLLKSAVDAVRSNPQRFNLDRPMVEQRQANVDGLFRRLGALQRMLGTARFRADTDDGGVGSSSSGSNRPRSGGGRRDGPSAGFDPQDGYHMQDLEDGADAESEALLKQHDMAMEDLSRTIGEVRNVASSMDKEVTKQNRLIDAISDRVTTVRGRLNVGMGQMETMLKENEGPLSNCCITMLIVVLIILLVLLVVL